MGRWMILVLLCRGAKEEAASDSGFEFGVGAKVIYIKSIFNHLVYLK